VLGADVERMSSKASSMPAPAFKKCGEVLGIRVCPPRKRFPWRSRALLSSFADIGAAAAASISSRCGVARSKPSRAVLHKNEEFPWNRGRHTNRWISERNRQSGVRCSAFCMVVYSKMRPLCRRAIADMPRSFARDFHPVHAATNARQARKSLAGISI